MQGNPVGWFEIRVRDIDRAKAFYEAVFEVRLERLDTADAGAGTGVEMWAFPMREDRWGASGALVGTRDAPAGAGGGVLVYFTCVDCAVEADRVAAAGGHLRQPKTSIGRYGHFALAHDPEGNLIGLHSMQ